MRELHDGIELLDEERNGGPFVFRNWDKWVDRCEQVISVLDRHVFSGGRGRKTGPEWLRRGFACGVPWPMFRKAVENYRKWLIETLGGLQEINKQLVFAHNDVSSLRYVCFASELCMLTGSDSIWKSASDAAG